MNSCAMSRHCSSDRYRSTSRPVAGSFAAASTRWYTGLAASGIPAALHRGLEQLGEPRVVPPAGAGDGWLEGGRVAVPGGDHARVDVRGAEVLLPRLPFPVQVGEQPDHATAAAGHDLADHAARRPRRRRGCEASPALTSAAVSSSRRMTRPVSAATRSSHGGGSPVAWNRATA